MSFQDEIRELNENRINKIMNENDSLMVINQLYNDTIDNIISSLKDEIKRNIENNKVMVNDDGTQKREWVESSFSFSSVKISTSNLRQIDSGDYFAIKGLDISNINDVVKKKLYKGILNIKGIYFIYLKDTELVLKELYNVKPTFMANSNKRNVELTENGVHFFRDIKNKAKESGIDVNLYFEFDTFHYSDKGPRLSRKEYKEFSSNSIVIKSIYYTFKSGSLCIKAKVSL